MGVQELRAESQRRGLGTARSKADLIQRLTDHDAKQDSTVEDDFADDTTPSGGQVASGESAENDLAQTPISTPEAAPSAGSTPPPIRAFRKTFQAEAGGPDEETHLAYRDATRQAAVEAGLIPRGDARLAEASDDVWVYEILVRQVT